MDKSLNEADDDRSENIALTVIITHLRLSLSLKRVYLYRKLIILNEKNKSALNG